MTLQGTCSCGRNHYHIISPPSFQEIFTVLYDDHSRSLSLRVPLSHIQSTTYAFYPDETHNTIRRVFIPRHAPHIKRHFCGFCGTSLTHWNEETADWVHVNFGSLKSESVERLAEEGVLKSKEMTVEGREIGDVHWFEDMMGRIRSQGQSQNKVEWEVVEFSDENTVNTGKRKLDDVTRRQT